MGILDRPDPEHLLGGYATGTLTPAEKALLFQAALKDQALFDALADEEVLRELLADPQARRRLLAVLPRKKPLYLRPPFLAMAAGLMLVVATSLMVEKTKPQALQRAIPPPAPSPRGLSETPAAPAPSRKVPQPEQALTREDGLARPAPAPETPRELKAEATAPATPQPSLGLAKKASAAPAANHQEAEGALSAGAALADRSFAARTRTKEAAAAPMDLRLEHLPGGLRVLWGGAGHLYVLRRGLGTTSILPAASTRTLPEGGGEARFEFTLKKQEVLDIYLLRSPIPDPAALPAEGPVDGIRRRFAP